MLGVRASDRSQRLPPGSCWQLLEEVLPESVRTVQDGNGLRGSGWCRIICLEPAWRSMHAKPLRVPFPPVASDEVPQPPRDRRKGGVTVTSGRTQDSSGPVRGIGTIGPGACPADRTAAGHRLPEVFVVGEPGEPAPGALVHVVGQPNDVSPGVTHAPGTFAAPSPVRARLRSTFDQRRASPGVRGSGTKPSRR